MAITNFDPRIDSYIDNATDFATPILERIRQSIHKACPEVTETIKWGSPAFEYKGILAVVSAMKSYVMFNLWKGELIPELKALYDQRPDAPFGPLGRLVSMDDLPPDDTLIKWIKAAADLNQRGVKLPQRTRDVKREEVVTPDDLIAGLEQNEAARQQYESFSDSKRREYVEWITEAKTDSTRHKRLLQAVEWIAEGKSRNWKYQK